MWSTPAANYNGPALFTYTVSDGNGGTSTATATATVNDGGCRHRRDGNGRAGGSRAGWLDASSRSPKMQPSSMARSRATESDGHWRQRRCSFALNGAMPAPTVMRPTAVVEEPNSPAAHQSLEWACRLATFNANGTYSFDQYHGVNQQTALTCPTR